MKAADFVAENRITDAELRGYKPSRAADSLRSILEYHVEVTKLFGGESQRGDTLPWAKTHSKFRFRPGEVTLWHGINGHGKSAVTSQVALWLALGDVKSCLASFEMLPARTLERMVSQAAGNGSPSQKFIDDFFVSLCRRIWIYDHLGRVDCEMLFQAMRYAAQQKGVRHFFVDSLMKCVPKSDDRNGQSDFINAVCDVAHETALHVHVVHHCRKGDDEKTPPNKLDARGAGEITDQVDNVIAVWRNKAKEREREEAIRLGNALNEETPDFLLICDKQRNGKWEGVWALWGDVASGHFRESPQSGWQRGYELPPYEYAEPGVNR